MSIDFGGTDSQAEIAFSIVPNAQRRRFAGEALGAIVDALDRLRVDREQFALTRFDRDLWLSRPRDRPERIEFIELFHENAFTYSRLATHRPVLRATNTCGHPLARLNEFASGA